MVFILVYLVIEYNNSKEEQAQKFNRETRVVEYIEDFIQGTTLTDNVKSDFASWESFLDFESELEAFKGQPLKYSFDESTAYLFDTTSSTLKYVIIFEYEGDKIRQVRFSPYDEK